MRSFCRAGRRNSIPIFLLDDLGKNRRPNCSISAAIDGRTIVDAQALGQERAPKLQKAASERSGVNIVACTGLHRGAFYPADHFRFRESADRLARRFIEEIESGMAIYRGSEVVERTDIRAGLIKFATDYHAIDDNARLVAEAVAAAHLATGAPILTHCEKGTCGLEQIELFEKLGVHPSSLILSHLDRNLDIYLHEDIADSGAYMVYDGISRVELHTDQEIIQMIRRMLERRLRPADSPRHGHGPPLDVEILRRRARHQLPGQRLPRQAPPRRPHRPSRSTPSSTAIPPTPWRSGNSRKRIEPL